MCTTSGKSATAFFVETRAQNQDNVGRCRTKLIIWQVACVFGRQAGVWCSSRHMFGWFVYQSIQTTPTPPTPPTTPTHKWWTPPCDISKVLFWNNLCQFGNQIYPPPPHLLNTHTHCLLHPPLVLRWMVVQFCCNILIDCFKTKLLICHKGRSSFMSGGGRWGGCRCGW